MEAKYLFGILIIIVFVLHFFPTAFYNIKYSIQKEEEKDEIIKKSHLRIRSLFINISVSIIVLSLSVYTDTKNWKIFVSHFNFSNFIYSLLIYLISLFLIYLTYTTIRDDLKDNRIDIKTLLKDILNEFSTCFLAVGSVFSLAYDNINAFYVSLFIVLTSILVTYKLNSKKLY